MQTEIPAHLRSEQPEPATAASPLDRLLAQIAERMKGRTGVEAVFGEARTVGERTLIPVARVAYGFGVGGGTGAPAKEGETQTASGTGAGGGFGVAATPIAVVEITPSRVRVVPIVDVNRLVMRAFAFAAVVATLGLLFGSRARAAAARAR